MKKASNNQNSEEKEYEEKIRNVGHQIESSKAGLAKIRETLQTCKPEQVPELVVAQTAIQQALTVNDKFLHDLTRAHNVQLEIQAGETERERKLRLIEKILKSPPPLCPGCGHGKHVKVNVRAPFNATAEELKPTPQRIVDFSRGMSWTTPVKKWESWHIDYVCTNPDGQHCSQLIEVYPDRPAGQAPEKQEAAEDEETSSDV